MRPKSPGRLIKDQLLDLSLIGEAEGVDLVSPEQELLARWKASIDVTQLPPSWSPAYDVYSDPRYKLVLYSTFADWSSMTCQRAVEFMTDAKLTSATILDLYGGLGHTSAYLALALPGAQVTYHNDVPQQVAVARGIFDRLGLKNVEVVDKVPGPRQVVLASELLEHFIEPAAFLLPILEQTRCEYLIDNSSYTQYMLGHFPAYVHEGWTVPPTQIGKLVGRDLRAVGFLPADDPRRFIRKGFWNHRPACWVRDRFPDPDRGLLTA